MANINHNHVKCIELLAETVEKAEKAALRATDKQWKEDVAALEAAVKEKEEEIGDLENKLQSAEMDFDLQYGAKIRALEQIAALTAECVVVKKTAEEQQGIIAVLTAKLAEFEKQIKALVHVIVGYQPMHWL